MMVEPNFQPFKEPRGFIRLLQWLFAICAFATTVDYSGRFGFSMTCINPPQTGRPPVTTRAFAVVEYPYIIDHLSFTFYPPPECYLKPDLGQIADAKSEAVFFVFTGVISFLYATATIAVYLLADKVYTENKKAPLVDFVITIILAVFWIAGSSAWAHGVSTVSSAMDAKQWAINTRTCLYDYNCSNFFHDAHAKLIISVLFGFINFVLWSGNIWFLYKETEHIINSLGIGVRAAPTIQPSSGTGTEQP